MPFQRAKWKMPHQKLHSSLPIWRMHQIYLVLAMVESQRRLYLHKANDMLLRSNFFSSSVLTLHTLAGAQGYIPDPNAKTVLTEGK